jgi:hypothetical protein
MRRFLTSRGLPAAALAAAALLAAGCSSSAGSADPYKIGALPAAAEVAKGKAAGHWVKEDGGATLKFAGTVTPTSATEFTSLVTPSTKTIIATVTGGDLPAGLAIGQAVQARKLNLEVEGACAGPCADYWFPAAANRKMSASGSWLGYVPDLSETAGAAQTLRDAEAKLYAAAGVDVAKFHAALDAQLQESPGGSAASPVTAWMPDKSDLIALGYPQAAVSPLWLPPNLASANAQARAWGQVVAYKNTLVGLATMPTPAAPPAPSGSGSAGASGGASPSGHASSTHASSAPHSSAERLPTPTGSLHG